MNMRMDKFLSARGKRSWRRLPALALLAVGCASLLVADDQQTSPDLVVHEWGTFTAVAGKDGKAATWSPLNGSTDLPRFVEHFADVNYKRGLVGTIRMETPVLYFYSARDATVSVNVSFSKGVITEWYPDADRVQPSEILPDNDLSRLRTDGTITWRAVGVSPNLSGEFPRVGAPSRYYAARETSSAPLRVNTTAGEQREKFLFYRGVSAASLPLSAKVNADRELLVRSLDESEIPAILLFERRGDRIGYRLVRSPANDTILKPPVLTGDLDSLGAELESILVDQGLYTEEARAMVATWRDSWFEEGSRLIYIVPRTFVDKILPLTINPAPAEVVRVFVGRLEIITPETVKAVKDALASHDEATLNKYQRFLEPILQIVNP